MNQEEYKEKIKQIEKEAPQKPEVTFNEAQPERKISPDAFEMKKGDPTNKDKIRDLINRYDDQIPVHTKEEREQENQNKSLTELSLEQQIEEAHDISEFLQTQEYIRMGTDARTPIPIKLYGKTYNIYIRPLSSNEYYKLQLKQINEKKSLNYLAAIKVCTDSAGHQLPSKFWDTLGFELVERIGEAISIASGGEPQEKVQEAISKLLED
jgi:hypothetical protein